MTMDVEEATKWELLIRFNTEQKAAALVIYRNEQKKLRHEYATKIQRVVDSDKLKKRLLEVYDLIQALEEGPDIIVCKAYNKELKGLFEKLSLQ